MLKLPGVGTRLNDYQFTTRIINNRLEVAIIYRINNSYGQVIHKMQNYELFADTTHPNLNNIKTDIDQKLNQALGVSNCTIKLYKARNYVYVDSSLYSGSMVL